MAEEKAGGGGVLDVLIKEATTYWHVILIGIIIFFAAKNDSFAFFLYKTFLNILPLLGVVGLGMLAWKLWVHYVQQDFISGIEFILLEIVPPREVLRSPRAMELFFTNALYHWSMKGGLEAYWQGAVWFWFSLEIVSIDGQVHFYIRTPSRLKTLIETQMYAQYPQAQVKVVEDYTLAVDRISEDSEWMGWGCEWKLLKHEAFPIKTYVDFGLDKDPKEEFKVDPISPVIELFGSLKKGEQMWVQIVITPSKKEYPDADKRFSTHNWVKESEIQLYKLLADYSSYKEVQTADQIGIGRSRKEIRVPPHLEDTFKKMKAKTTKLGFDVGIRSMYIAKKEAFDLNNRRNIRLIWRQYADPNSNELWRCNNTAPDAYMTNNHFGNLFMLSQKTVLKLADRMLEEYRERAFFYPPLRHHLLSQHNLSFPFNIFFKAYFHHNIFVLNVEELATLWHFPGQILKVPTLERIESKESAPPTNLPI